MKLYHLENFYKSHLMKTDHTKFLLLILILILPAILSAQTPMKDPAAFKAGLAATARTTKSIESNFMQEKHLAMLSENIKTRGKFYFLKEDKLRWEYTEPFKYLFILNGGKIFIKDDNRESKFDVNSNKMFREINVILMGSVQGTLLNDQKRFSAGFFENKMSYIVKLRPLTSQLKQSLSEIIINFDKTDYSVTRMEMHEPSGDYTKIDFTGKKINIPVDNEKFIIP